MKETYVSDLRPNQIVVSDFLVRAKEVRSKKTGGNYLSLALADKTGEVEAKVWDNVELMQTSLRDAGVSVGDSESQVIPLMIRDDARIFEIGEALMQEGIYINPVKYPAVPKHKSRFRMSISAAHSREELEQGARTITSVLQR